MNEELKVIISAEISKLKQGVNDAKKSLKDFVQKNKSNMKDLEKGFKDASATANKALAAIGAAALATVGALLNLSDATKEYRTNQAKLDTAFQAAGASAGVARDVYNDLYRVLGDDGQATEAAAHIAQITTNEQEMAEWTTICEGVYATFGDSLPIEGLTESANETIKVGKVTGVLADALNWAGISEDEFNEKLAACRTEEERATLVRQTLNGQYQEAASIYEDTAESILAANEAEAANAKAMAALGEAMEPIKTTLTDFQTKLAEEITPIIEDIVDKYGPDIETFLENLATDIGNVITWIVDNWDTISTVGTVILVVAAALAVLSATMTVVNAVMYASPITWIVAAIVALIAAIALCIIYWDDIKEAISNAWETIKEKTSAAVEAVVQWFTDMKEKISNKVQEIKDKVREKFEEIKQAISDKVQAAKDNVVNKFTEIKDKVSNKVQEIKDKVKDKFEEIKNNMKEKIDAAKTTVLGIFDSIKNGIQEKINNAKDKVKEAIDKIKDFFNFSWSLPKLKLPHISISGKFSLDPLSVPKFSISWNALGGVFDKPTLFGFGDSLQGLGEDGAEAVVPLEKNLGWLNKLADMLSERLGSDNSTPIILQVDGTTFAQTSIRSINQLTKQTGSLGLVIE